MAKRYFIVTEEFPIPHQTTSDSAKRSSFTVPVGSSAYSPDSQQLILEWKIPGTFTNFSIPIRMYEKFFAEATP